MSEFVKKNDLGNTFFIGIDGGKNCGFAVWNQQQKRFETIQTLLFWDCIMQMGNTCKEHFKNKDKVVMVVEDIRLNKPVFGTVEMYEETEGEHENKLKAVCERAKRVGTAWAKTDLIIEWIERNKIQCIKIRPHRGGSTKMNAASFKEKTNYQHRTSNHGRDAAMMVYGR